MSFNLGHLILDLTNFLVLLHLLLSVGDNVGSSKVLLQPSITLLNSSQVTAKVPLTVGEHLILGLEVKQVTVTILNFLGRRSFIVTLHLLECLLTLSNLLFGFDLAGILLVLLQSQVILLLLLNELVLDPFVPLLDQVELFFSVLDVFSLNLFAQLSVSHTDVVVSAILLLDLHVNLLLHIAIEDDFLSL